MRRRSRPSNGAASEAGRIAAHRNGRNSSNNARYQKWFIFGAVALALCGIYLYNAFKQTAARGRSITPFRGTIFIICIKIVPVFLFPTLITGILLSYFFRRLFNQRVMR